MDLLTYAMAQKGGGGAPLIVDMTPTSASGSTYAGTVSISCADIYAAFMAGRIVIIHATDDDTRFMLSAAKYTEGATHEYRFCCIGCGTDDKGTPLQTTAWSTGTDNVGFLLNETQPVLPDYDILTDAGNVLSVTSGGLDWVTPQ